MKGDVVPREGSWALVILNLDSCLLCILPGQLERPGKHSNHYAEGFQTKQKKTSLKPMFVFFFLANRTVFHVIILKRPGHAVASYLHILGY